jgi:hypothetical protein
MPRLLGGRVTIQKSVNGFQLHDKLDVRPASVDRRNLGEAPMRRLKLGTLIVWIVILALSLALFIQQRREARLKSALAIYRNRGQEEIQERLLQPANLTHPDETPLEDLLKELKTLTKGGSLPSGMPIYVDPLGLTEADVTLMTPVKAVRANENLTLREQLQQILKPLGLSFKAENGYLLITSEESLDLPKDGQDPYLMYRDVLK